MSVLITGGSGFLGHGLVRAFLERGEQRVGIYSRNEHAQAEMRDEFNNDKRLRWMIGDIRDLPRLRWAMAGVGTVIAAAALKRIEVGVYDPSEMVKTNIFGTMNVVDAAAYCGVKKVVAISSDKAWQPTSSIYGLSKAIAERLILAGDVERRGPRYAVCRYGNVSGSTGSVIPRWREILKTSDTVPVTDSSCTRFWMTRGEAVDFVMDTVDTMKGGEIRIPDLPAYRLGDLAKAMGAARVEIIGLPEWEKRHEGMAEGNTSDRARRMSVDELRRGLQDA